MTAIAAPLCVLSGSRLAKYRPKVQIRRALRNAITRKGIAVADELWKWDAVALAQAIRAREISSRDAVGASIARMRAVNPQLNAVTCEMSDAALAAADRADEAVARNRKSNEPLGALHGVPVTIKENVDQEGCATVNGVAA